jgi:hypothetical protein
VERLALALDEPWRLNAHEITDKGFGPSAGENMDIKTNKAQTLQCNADVLKRFSRELMELTQLSRCSIPERWLCEAVQGFANIVGFDAAWWGQLYLPSDTSSSTFSPSVMMDGSLGLSSTFAQEWHSISGVRLQCPTWAKPCGEAMTIYPTRIAPRLNLFVSGMTSCIVWP